MNKGSGSVSHDDHHFIERHSQWAAMAGQTARQLERQIGRPESEFNRDCLKQELLWQVCRAFRRDGIRNHTGLATTVIRNRARDILRRARASGRIRTTVSLNPIDEQRLSDNRQHHRHRLQGLRQRLDSLVARLPELQKLAVVTACQSENAAATEIGISRRQLRKMRFELRVELERHGLREFL